MLSSLLNNNYDKTIIISLNLTYWKDESPMMCLDENISDHVIAFRLAVNGEWKMARNWVSEVQINLSLISPIMQYKHCV